MLKVEVSTGNIFIMTKAKIEEELAKTGLASGSEWWKAVLDLNLPILDVYRFPDEVTFTLRKDDTVVDINFKILDEPGHLLSRGRIDGAWVGNLEKHTTDVPKENVHFHSDEKGDVNVVIIHLEDQTAVVVYKGRILTTVPVGKTISDIQKEFNPGATPVEKPKRKPE